jgi:hypothetical protein
MKLFAWLLGGDQEIGRDILSSFEHDAQLREHGTLGTPSHVPGMVELVRFTTSSAKLNLCKARLPDAVLLQVLVTLASRLIHRCCANPNQ